MSKNNGYNNNRPLNAKPPVDTTTTPVGDEDLKLENDDLNDFQETTEAQEAKSSANPSTEPSGEDKSAKEAEEKAAEEAAAKSAKEAEEKAAAEKKAKEEEDAKAKSSSEAKVPGVGLNDVISVIIKRTPSKNGTAMISVEDIIDLILEYPLCTIEVRECHVAPIYQHIKSIKRTKRFAVIGDKARVLMIENWKRTYYLK